uniref:PDDEXK nuclease domain-containing protein n=1 Tax=Segatella hominis TaxID=2518605 RepID=UPI004027220B
MILLLMIDFIFSRFLWIVLVIELKAQSFHPSFLGQLSFYVSAINHHFKTDIDNPTIGLLICKDKDNVVAKYALESYKELMGISENISSSNSSRKTSNHLCRLSRNWKRG